jgi:hypothetical protein
MTSNGKSLRVSENFNTPDIFCDSLVRIECFGAFARLVFAVPRKTDYGSEDKSDMRDELEIVAKIIVPRSVFSKMSRQLVGTAMETEPTLAGEGEVQGPLH